MSELEIEEGTPKVEEQPKKQKRKINISDEERKKRSDRMKQLAKKRTEVAEEKKSKIKEVKIEVKDEAKKIIEKKVRKIKQPPVIQPESSDDSDSEDETIILGKQKRKYIRKTQPNIIIKNYTQSAPTPTPQLIPPVFQQQPSVRDQSPPKHIGYFV